MNFLSLYMCGCFLKQELSQAQRLLEKIKSFEERRSLCLVYYAVGKVYVKENRYRSFQSCGVLCCSFRS